MNTRTKRFAAVACLLLVLLHGLSAAVQNPLPKVGKVFTDFGVESELPMPSEVIRRTIIEIPPGMSVPDIRRSPLLFSQAGGIMFDSLAQPCAGLADARMRLVYDPRRRDGQRLMLRAGARDYTVSGVYDRDLRPIAEFANGNVPILTNVQYPDKTITGSCPTPGDLKIVTLHEAFLNTNLGRLLTSMDSIPWSFSRGKRWQMTSALPAATLDLSKSLASALVEDESTYATEVARTRTKLINEGQSIISLLSAQDKQRYMRDLELNRRNNFDWEKYEEKILADPNIDRSAWDKLSVDDRHILLLMLVLDSHPVSNFNDDGAPPSFCASASSVTLDGSPRLEFVAPWYMNNYVLPKSSRLMMENLSQLRLVEPETYDGVLEIYRLAGLFRYFKQRSPLAWGQFFRSLPPKERQETYTIVCPDCKRADVQAWLSCVEKKVRPSD
jgi:hypothetical protein